MNDKEFMEYVHMEIHALRRIGNYKPSLAEVNIAKLVVEKFKDTCKECKERSLYKAPDKPKTIFQKIGDVINNE